MRVLLTEDNQELARSIKHYFKDNGHAIDWVDSAEKAATILHHDDFDVLILDVNLPGKSGFELLSTLRSNKNALPVLILTARADIDDRVSALDLGADDYLVKPFDLRELAARCRALVRRERGKSDNEILCGNLAFNSATKIVKVDGEVIDMRPREVQMLELFITHLDRMLTKDDIANRLYNFDEAYTPNAIEQTLTRLRKHLQGSSVLIKTVRGMGYLAHVDD
ncbi:response regulator transcription factor [Marinomonas ostreistagni]|uniref:response regulator transcription factor n=1 Tax=Marinomonas ostreistagni TaxID=359209 RepID=UPI00194E1629|nr:response regulator transcription factor [Marinomonas ostreistagni]MBM6549787.1 response regulator transcription factor [Marinomonas ostreistagni]